MDPDTVAEVIAEARAWIGTPYHHNAAVKGAGVDCARLLIEVYAAAGVIDPFDPGPYPPDWHLHRSEERYVSSIETYALERPLASGDPQPAEIVVWRYGRTFSHGAIVTAWPRVVHAFGPARIVEETDVRGSMMDGRAMRIFTPRPAG